jgi:hypothetical protein
VDFYNGTARPLEAHEQALLETVKEAARGVLAADAATLEVRWVRGFEEDFPSWPWFELRPRREGALPIALGVVAGNDWIDTALYLDEESVSFELWAETEEERLRLTAERIEAVIWGRAQVELRGRLMRPLLGLGRRRMVWEIVAMFETARGPTETSRFSVDPSSWRDVFADSPADEASGRIGPKSFAPYL